MPVSLTLNDAQLEVFNAAIKNRKVEYKTLGRNNIQLTAENWAEIRDAIQELHDKKFKVRTKTREHLETCYYADQIVAKIIDASSAFGIQPMNDNSTVVAVETSSDEEVKPILDDAWFEGAEKINPVKETDDNGDSTN